VSRFRENVISLGMLQIVSTVLPIVTLPYLALTLGASALGRVAFCLSVAQFVVIVTDFGFNFTGSREVAVYRDDRRRMAETFWSVTVAKLVMTLLSVACIALLCTINATMAANAGLLALTLVLPLGNLLLPIWFYQGLQELRTISIIQIVVRFIFFALTFVLVRGDQDGATAVVLQSSPGIVAGALTLLLTKRVVPGLAGVRIGFKTVWPRIVEAWPVFVANVSISIYTTSNVAILGTLLSSAALAQFHIAEKIVRAFQTMLSPVFTAAYPKAAALAAEDRAALERFNRKVLKLALAFSTVGAFGMFIFGPTFVRMTFGPEFEQAGQLLRLFALLPIFTAISGVYGQQNLMPLGRQGLVSAILVSAAILDLVIFTAGTRWFGNTGAVLASVTVEMYVALLCVVAAKRIVSRSPAGQ
jgi:PST family polysaccharide transporter